MTGGFKVSADGRERSAGTFSVPHVRLADVEALGQRAGWRAARGARPGRASARTRRPARTPRGKTDRGGGASGRSAPCIPRRGRLSRSAVRAAPGQAARGHAAVRGRAAAGLAIPADLDFGKAFLFLGPRTWRSCGFEAGMPQSASCLPGINPATLMTLFEYVKSNPTPRAEHRCGRLWGRKGRGDGKEGGHLSSDHGGWAGRGRQPLEKQCWEKNVLKRARGSALRIVPVRLPM